LSNVDAFAAIIQTDVTQIEISRDVAALRIFTNPRGKQATNMHLEQVTFDSTNNTSVLIRASATILFGIHNLWFQSQM
jgi:hypothetical protein